MWSRSLSRMAMAVGRCGLGAEGGLRVYKGTATRTMKAAAVGDTARGRMWVTVGLLGAGTVALGTLIHHSSSLTMEDLSSILLPPQGDPSSSSPSSSSSSSSSSSPLPPSPPATSMHVQQCLTTLMAPTGTMAEKKRALWEMLCRMNPEMSRAGDAAMGTPQQFRVELARQGARVLLEVLDTHVEGDAVLNVLAAQAIFFLAQEEVLRAPLGRLCLPQLLGYVASFRSYDVYVLRYVCDTITFLIDGHTAAKNFSLVAESNAIHDLCTIVRKAQERDDDAFADLAIAAAGLIEKILHFASDTHLSQWSLTAKEKDTVVSAVSSAGIELLNFTEVNELRTSEREKRIDENVAMARMKLMCCMRLMESTPSATPSTTPSTTPTPVTAPYPPAPLAPTPYRFGLCFWRLGYIDDALNCFEFALTRNPDSPVLLWRTATILHTDPSPERRRRAIDHYLRIRDHIVKSQSPSKSLTVPAEEGVDEEDVTLGLLDMNIAKVYFSLGEDANAIQFIQSAIRTDPTNSAYLHLLARIHKHTQSYEKAVAGFSAALQHSPTPSDECSIYYNLCVCHQKMSQYPLAVRECDKAIALDPSHIDAKLAQAKNYECLREYDKSLRIYNELTLLCPDDSRVTNGLARLRTEMSDIQQAPR
jgi:tetratricopeptide (TPR) repeat protein